MPATRIENRPKHYVRIHIERAEDDLGNPQTYDSVHAPTGAEGVDDRAARAREKQGVEVTVETKPPATGEVVLLPGVRKPSDGERDWNGDDAR